MKSDTKSDNRKISVYYNSACPVCKVGADYMQSKTPACEIIWNDVHLHAEKVQETESDREFIRERLHVRDVDGNFKIGIDAFIAIWKASTHEKWKATLFSLPVIHGFCSVSYKILARGLYKYNRFKKNW